MLTDKYVEEKVKEIVTGDNPEKKLEKFLKIYQNLISPEARLQAQLALVDISNEIIYFSI